MKKRIRSRLNIACAALVLIGTVVTIGSVATEGIAGADSEISSGTRWLSTGWVQEPFFTCDNGCPVWSWAEYIGGISWQAWNISGGGHYDKMTQDFWKGLLGSEAGSGDPYPHDAAYIYVSGYGSAHYDGGTYISTVTGDGTCPQYAMPPWIPCEESQSNTNGHHYSNPIDYGYIEYGSNYGYPPEYPNGAQTLTVLSGYIS
jgi:hypothetical protein